MQKKTPLYVKIMNHIRRNIEKGNFSAGEKIYTEAEICRRHHVSRITAIRALRELVNEGLLVRHQGRGTFVSPVLSEDSATGRVEMTVINEPGAGVVGTISESLTGSPLQPVVMLVPDWAGGYMGLLGKLHKKLEPLGIPVCIDVMGSRPERFRQLVGRWFEKHIRGVIAVDPSLAGFAGKTLPSLPAGWYESPPKALPPRHLLLLGTARLRAPLPPNLLVDTFSLDAADSMRQLIDFLVSSGCRKIAYIGHSPDMAGSEEARELFSAAAGDFTSPDRVFLDDFSPTMRGALRALLESPADSRPDAIVIEDDELAFDLYAVLDAALTEDDNNIFVGCFRERFGLPQGRYPTAVLRPPFDEWGGFVTDALDSRRNGRTKPWEVRNSAILVVRNRPG